MKIKIKKDFGDFKKDQIVKVKSNGGIPLDGFWRRRLADAKHDDCCEIFGESKIKPESKSKAKVVKKTDK